MRLQHTYDSDLAEDMDYDVGSFRAIARVSSGKRQTPQEQAWMWRRIDRRQAEIVAQRWIDRPDTRLSKTQWLGWWKDRNAKRYQVPDWKLLENASNDLRRAVRIKRTGEGNISGQPSLTQARFNWRCEMLYKRKKEALANV